VKRGIFGMEKAKMFVEGNGGKVAVAKKFQVRNAQQRKIDTSRLYLIHSSSFASGK
jgi:hypothetical protein